MINNIFRKIMKLFLNVSSCAFLVFLIKKTAGTSNLQNICIFVYFILMHIFIEFYFQYKKINYRSINKYYYLGCTVVIIVLLFSFYQKSIILKKNMFQILTITVLDEKNLKSQGMEAWVSNISIDGKKVPESSITLENGWYNKDGVYYANGNEKINNEIVVDLPKGKKIEVIFDGHEWSGEVLLKCEGLEKKLDLYTSPPGEILFQQERYFLPVNSNFKLLIIIGYCSSLIILCKFLTCSLFNSKKKKLLK